MFGKLTSQFALTRTAKILVAALLLSTGLYLSFIEFMGQEWTSRAGCLIAMLGIWSGLGGIVEERMLATSIKRKQRNAITLAEAKLSENDADTEAIEAELAQIRETYDAQLAHAAEKLKLSVGFEEVSLVLAGSFIWGFGDLLWS